MKKLKLRLDNLAVESFDTTCRAREQGTVFGEQCTCWTQCGQNTCPGCPTCDQTCAYTCDDISCGGQTCYGPTCEGTCFQNGCGISQYETCPLFCPRVPDPF